MLRGKTCTHTHRFKSLALRMPSDVASLLSLWLLSSSFQFFFFLAQTPPLRPCRWAVYLSPPSPVSDLLFMSLHLSLFPPLWSRVWVLLGERCATQMMSHPVTLSSPPLLSSPFLTLQPSRLSHRTEHFSPYKTNSDLSHVPQDGTRGHTTAVISSSRRPLRLTETSNRHFRKSSRHHINRRTLLQTCRCLVVCRYRHFLIFFFCSNTLFFSPLPPACTRVEFKCFSFLKAVMEYDMLIIFPRPWQIALTAYYACFLTFVLFVSLPRWPLNLGFVGNGR